MDDQIDPHIRGILEKRRCPGIVDDRFDPVLFRQLRDLAQRLQCEGECGRTFQVDDLGVRADSLFELLNGLTEEQQKAAFAHLSAKIINRPVGGFYGRA